MQAFLAIKASMSPPETVIKASKSPPQLHWSGGSSPKLPLKSWKLPQSSMEVMEAFLIFDANRGGRGSFPNLPGNAANRATKKQNSASYMKAKPISMVSMKVVCGRFQ